MEVLNPNNFWNICFLTGALMVFIGLGAARRPLRLPLPGRAISIGPISKAGQILLSLSGIALLATSVFLVAFTNMHGLIQPSNESVPKLSVEEEAVHRGQPSMLSLAWTAHAAGQAPKLVSSTVAAQHVRWLAVAPFNGQVALYVGHIPLRGSARVVVFQSSGGSRHPNRAMPYEELRRGLGVSQILQDGTVSSGQSLPFQFQGRRFELKVELKWYAFGSGQAEFVVSES